MSFVPEGDPQSELLERAFIGSVPCSRFLGPDVEEQELITFEMNGLVYDQLPDSDKNIHQPPTTIKRVSTKREIAGFSALPGAEHDLSFGSSFLIGSLIIPNPSFQHEPILTVDEQLHLVPSRRKSDQDMGIFVARIIIGHIVR